MTAAKPIEIFRPGRHTSMAGEMLAFAEADLAACARAYDPAKHEAPLVVGHPAHDRPAYGWVRSLTSDAGSLQATPHQVDAAFAELVAAGRYKKISAAFYRPDAPGNPVPGTWYLRHVGFLGAQPPAVKGLKPVELAEEEAGVVAFADIREASSLSRSIASLFRGVRDALIADQGIGAADAVLPGWQIDDLTNRAGALESARSSFSEPGAAATQEETAMAEKTDHDKASAALAERQAALDAREQKFAADQAAFAEERAKARKEAATAFCEGLVGRLTPAQVPVAAAVLAALEAGEKVDPVAFAEGADKKPLADHFRALLSALPEQVDFSERTPSGNPPSNATDGEAIGEAASAYMAEQAKAGITVSADVAVRHVMGRKS